MREYFKHPISTAHPLSIDKILHFCSIVLGEFNGMDSNFSDDVSNQTKMTIKTLSEGIISTMLYSFCSN